MIYQNYKDRSWALIYDQFNHGRHEKERQFYLAELRDCHGPALEIACGTGMIFFPLLKAGIDLYGFDVSDDMLNILYAEAENENISDIHERISKQDMRDFHYDHMFDAIFIPARSFVHLTEQEDQIACLRNIYAHLNPGGRLLLNFFKPDVNYLAAHSTPSETYKLIGTYSHPDTGESINLMRQQVNDFERQLQSIRWKFDMEEGAHETTMAVRWIYKEEFQLLLRLAGFQKWNLYGDFDKSTLSETSDELIWIAEKD